MKGEGEWKKEGITMTARNDEIKKTNTKYYHSPSSSS